MTKLLICFLFFANVKATSQADAGSCKLKEFYTNLTTYDDRDVKILRGFTRFQDLDTKFCNPNDFKCSTELYLYPSRKLILNNDLDFDSLVPYFCISSLHNILFQVENLLGIDSSFQDLNDSGIGFELHLSNTRFDFYQDGPLTSSMKCEKQYFNLYAGISTITKLCLKKTVK
jgi:hypothetical protein